MTAKKTRMLFSAVSIITIICILVGFLLIYISASISDYHAEIKESVPGNIDIKIGLYSLIFMLIAIIGIQIIKKVDFSAMYDLRKVPVYCSHEIKNMRIKNVVFRNQVNESLKRYYNGDWGILCNEDKELNNEAVKNGTDRVLASYPSIYGQIYIITEADRSATTILFVREY